MSKRLETRLADTEEARAAAVEQAATLRSEYQQEIVRQAEVAAEEIEKLEKRISSLICDKVNLEDRLDEVRGEVEREVAEKVIEGLEPERKQQAAHAKWLARDKSMQTDQSQQKDKEVQTNVRTYADVLAQTEGEVKERLNTTDEMEIESLASPARSITAEQIPTAKDNEGSPTSRQSAKAFVMHSIGCLGPMTAKLREVERAFGKKGGGVIGCRWLLQLNRRKGKTSSSMVVFLRLAVPTATDMWVRMKGRKHTVEEYESGRKGTSPGKGW